MAKLLLKRIKDWTTSITSFRTGDCIPVDGPSGTAKMNKDDFLALIGNSHEIYQQLKLAMLRGDRIAGGIKPRIFGTNWFNQSNLLHGKWVSYQNGTVNDNPDYSCTQLTPIEESATYHAKNSTNGDQIAFYDINLEFIGGVLLSLQSDTEFHTPAGARFARYCTETANLTPFYIVKDSAIMWKDPYHFRGWYEGDEIIVAKDGSGYFTTLTEAASYAVDGDVIHVKAGVYDNEAVQLFGKTVTVYGDGCLNTIVKNGWNTYSKAPIEMTTGVLRDIQFYAYDGGSPSQDPSGATAYALHVDSDTSYGKTFLVERCIFISEKGNNAVGVGIYGGCDFIFRDCQFIGGVSNPFYVHDSTNTQYVGVMDLELYNNTFMSFGNGCFGIDAARLNGTTVYLTACGNNFHDNGTPAGLPHLLTGEVLYPPDNQPGPATGNTNIGVVNWNTKPLNNGNNLPIFNGGYQYATQSAEWITHGQFGTDRIEDDAITADKVKDNETLPVNISGNAATVNSHTVDTNVPSNAVFIVYITPATTKNEVAAIVSSGKLPVMQVVAGQGYDYFYPSWIGSDLTFVHIGRYGVVVKIWDNKVGGWTDVAGYDTTLSSDSTNAVQNSTLYAVIGNVEALLAAL